jgi:mRNA-degrading endonuclease toxin of MazEF toxin-antitoxin module
MIAVKGKYDGMTVTLDRMPPIRECEVVIAAPISTTQRRLPLYNDLPDKLNTKGTVLLDQLVTLDY